MPSGQGDLLSAFPIAVQQPEHFCGVSKYIFFFFKTSVVEFLSFSSWFATWEVLKMTVFSCGFKDCGSKWEFLCRKWGFARGRFINQGGAEEM